MRCLPQSSSTKKARFARCTKASPTPMSSKKKSKRYYNLFEELSTKHTKKHEVKTIFILVLLRVLRGYLLHTGKTKKAIPRIRYTANSCTPSIQFDSPSLEINVVIAT